MSSSDQRALEGEATEEANQVLGPYVVTQVVEDAPDGGYGWVQVGVAFTINCFTWGQTAVSITLIYFLYIPQCLTFIQSFGVYLAHYLSSNAFKNATPLDYALVGGLQFSMSMLVAPLVTITVRKFGTQIPMLAGIAVQTAGFIAASYSSRIQDVYISQGLVLGVGLGFIFVPSTPILAQWFSRRRSLAVGISSSGSGIGGLLFSFISQAMIDNLSLAWAFRITAAIVGAMNLVAVALIRNRNRIILPSQRGFDTNILLRYDVCLFLAWGFISMLGYITVLYSLPDFAESINLSQSRAAAISAFLNIGTAVGRPIIGLVSDRFGRIKVAAILTMCSGLTCFAIWLPATNYAVTVLFAITNGAVVGVFWMVGVPEPFT